MNGKDENAAWSCFLQTGRVQDYLIYTQCKQQENTGWEVPYANQYGWSGDTGEEYRGK